MYVKLLWPQNTQKTQKHLHINIHVLYLSQGNEMDMAKHIATTLEHQTITLKLAWR